MRAKRSSYDLAGLSLIFLAAFGVRFFAIASAPDAFSADPDAYQILAETWTKTGTYGQPADADSITDVRLGGPLDDRSEVRATAFRPPLYPFLLSLCTVDSSGNLSKDRLTVVHAFLGAATVLGAVVCSALLFRRSFPRISEPAYRTGVWSTGLLIAFDPILIRQSQLIMTETLATFLTVCLLTWGAWLIPPKQPCSPRYWTGLGFSIGAIFALNALCRPTALVWLLLGVAVYAWFPLLRWLGLEKKWSVQCSHGLTDGPSSNARWCFTSGLIGTILGFSLVMVPWGLRNQRELGVFRLTTTHGGYTLLLANNHSLYEHLERTWGRDWDETAFFQQWQQAIDTTTSEIEADSLAQQLALTTIRQQPWSFLMSCGARLSWLWIPWPNQGSTATKWIIGTFYVCLYALALIGVSYLLSAARKTAERSRSSPSSRLFWIWCPSILLVLSISLVHSVFWSNMRMRAVCMPTLSMIASLGLMGLIDRYFSNGHGEE